MGERAPERTESVDYWRSLSLIVSPSLTDPDSCKDNTVGLRSIDVI